MIADWWLEFRIDWNFSKWMATERRQYLDRMCELIRKRSVRQVAKMEREKGLA